jgi:endo-1,4-beta-xylanase
VKFKNTLNSFFIAVLAVAFVLTGCKAVSPSATGAESEDGTETETEKVTVTFNLDGGSPEIEPAAVDKGASLGNKFPAAPAKNGYSFDGWYNGTTQYLSNTPINDDITLTAKWEADPSYKPVTGFSLGKTSTTLTLYSGEQLEWTLSPANASNKNITWTSSNANVAAVDANGKITAAGVTANLSSNYTVTPATGSAVITAKTADGGFTAAITVNTTMTPQNDLMTLPPMKDQFANYFLMGNIAVTNDADAGGTAITKQSLLRHYNILTAENNMKPSYYGNNPNSLSFTGSDRFVNAARASGFKVHAHVLLWHSQNSAWINNHANSTKDVALTAMKKYITDVCTHFKGKIYSWDVLNEAFPDGVSASADWKNSIRKTGDSQAPNPWYVAIGSDFVYEGFLAARKADPNAILYYNDYNTDQAGKATMIRDMVRDVNARYLASNDKPAGESANRLLIEGIGMQEHHNTDVTTASIRNTINLFRPLGVKISVSELDVLAQSYSQYSSNPADNKNPATSNNTVTNQGLINHARLYGEYMKLYLDNADIIERVTLWGVTDNQSWRGRGFPLIFDPNGKAKPSYYKMITALEN